uniref:Transposase, mutator type n=1 Tax=Tanacetum cinerariifolium TaxID=118510 RepID=A0A6L2JJD6_TANCI|nr:transposase, mutator type [Tanacetum cinerariifolium]
MFNENDLDFIDNEDFDSDFGIVQDLAKVFPSAKHRYCLRKIHKHMKKQWNGLSYKQMLWKCAATTITIQGFEAVVEKCSCHTDIYTTRNINKKKIKGKDTSGSGGVSSGVSSKGKAIIEPARKTKKIAEYGSGSGGVSAGTSSGEKQPKRVRFALMNQLKDRRLQAKVQAVVMVVQVKVFKVSNSVVKLIVGMVVDLNHGSLIVEVQLWQHMLLLHVKLFKVLSLVVLPKLLLVQPIVGMVMDFNQWGSYAGSRTVETPPLPKWRQSFINGEIHNPPSSERARSMVKKSMILINTT